MSDRLVELYVLGTAIGAGFGLVWIAKMVACHCYWRCWMAKANKQHGATFWRPCG